MKYAESVFWISLGLVFYTYVGYGLIAVILVILKRWMYGKQELSDYEEWPNVTLIIPCFNERGILLAKIENTRRIDYPADRLRVLFITDGSDDGSEEFLSGFGEVECLHLSKRSGKSAAENRAMEHVNSDFVVFCDANTELNPESIKRLIRHYKDERVGGVSGEKRVRRDGSTEAEGEGLYWKYESSLKKLDAELWSLVGAAGELVSFRTRAMRPLPNDTILDDFVQSVQIAKAGFRFAYEPNAFALESASENYKEEYKRKVRIAAGGWQAMSRLGFFLNPFKNPLLSWMYVSHRVLRWSIAAFVLPLLFVLNAFLVGESRIYGLIFILQTLFYALAFLGYKSAQKGEKGGIGYVPFYFAMMNYAVFAGFARWAGRKQSAVWERAKRKEAA